MNQFAVIILVAFSIICLGLSAVGFHTADGLTFNDPLLPVVSAPAIVGIIALACLKLPKPYRLSLSLTVLAVLAATYAAELVVASRSPATRTPGSKDDDQRTVWEVVRDLRNRGQSAYPVVFGRSLLGSNAAGLLVPSLHSGVDPILPLGGIANVQTVYCKENGPYITYESDEHGFRNPKGLWSRSQIDIAAVGDSFTLGACVESDQHLIGRIRTHYAATINLGMAGNGPLLELASLKEYLPALRPRVVLWIFYEGNDLTKDIFDEQRSSILMSYLLPDFSQHLIERQDVIDKVLSEEVDRLFSLEKSNPVPAPPPIRLHDVVLFRNVRNALGLDAGRADLRLFGQIMREARRVVESWGGHLYVVYLPSERRYAGGPVHMEQDRQYVRVLSLLRRLEIPVIDIHATFHDTGRPRAMYHGHFTEEGYRKAADAVLTRLATDPWLQ